MKTIMKKALILAAVFIMLTGISFCEQKEDENETLFQIIGAWFLLNQTQSQTQSSGLTIKIPDGVPL